MGRRRHACRLVLLFLVRSTLHAGGLWYGVAQATWIAGLVVGSLGAGRLRTEPGQTWATIAGAAVTSPREIYAIAGSLGVAVAAAIAVFFAARAARTGRLPARLTW